MVDQGAEFDPGAFDVLTMDCYGTLIDWQGGIVDYLQPVLERHDAHVTDDFILEFFAATEPVLQREGGKYEDILRHILDRLGTRLGFVPTPAERDGFPASLGEWKSFPDTLDALARLGGLFQLAVISNVDDALFSLTRKALDVEFAHVMTAERAGAYKPDNRIFEAALKAIGCSRDRILHVAQSLFHDIAPASGLQLATVWIDRNRGAQGAAQETEAQPTWTFSTLGEFADAALR